ncbi:hypothetical protein BGZ58_000566 [Dissophora ornata]|nr:hypothetical protein BGZ58_000566 [Dissophora ornata]
MCTIGALFISEAPGSGILDDLVYDFYKRTLAIKEERPEDIATIQTSLILQDFFVVSHRIEEGTAFYIDMMEIAERIQLAEMVQKFATQDKLSPADVIVRNTWRLLVSTEILANMISLKSGKVHPMKDLTSPALEFRSEEVPDPKAPATDAVYYHYSSLFKTFQGITKIKLPMSLRDMHPVTSILDDLTEWHNGLPKSLKCSGAKNYAAGNSGSKAHAKALDLFFRLGHIHLLNSLPPSVRSSPTGLGLQRESPLRLLATCANGITGIMGDLAKEKESRNYSLIHGIRCLTEAATIQLANSKELDPAISTPAKVNFMKTLWCIKQFNVAVPTDTLNSILASFDTVGKQTVLTKWQGKQPADTGPKGISRPHTPPISSASAEPSMLPGPSHSGREMSMTSDYSSTTASTREGSHMIICETEENGRERERSSHLPAGLPQDGAAASLLALSLESPTVGHGVARVGPSTTSAFPRDVKYEGSGLGLQVPESLSQVAQQMSQRDVYDGDRSGSSSIAFSPRIESPIPGAYLSVEAQPQRKSSYSPHTSHRRSTAHPQHDQEYESARDTRYHRYSPGSGQADMDPSASSRTLAEPSWESQRHGLGERYMDEIKHGIPLGEPRMTDRSRSPVDNGQPILGPSSTRHISPSSTSSADYGTSYGPSSAQPRQPWDDLDASRSLLVRGDRQTSSYHPSQESHPSRRRPQDFYPAFGAYQPAAQDYHGPPRQLQSGDKAPRAGPQPPHLTTTFPRRPYHPQEQSPRTPLSAASDTDAYNGHGATQAHSARASAATTSRAYSPVHQRPDRGAFDPNAGSPGPESHEAGYRPRYLPARSGGGPLHPEMDSSRANLASPSSSPPPPAGFSTPVSPQSPQSTRLTVMTSNDSRRPLSALDPRGVEGTGSRGPGGYSPSGLNRTASLIADANESESPKVAGRKRPSVSMYSRSGREDDSQSSSYEGRGGVGFGGGMLMTKSDEMRRLSPGGYNADPLHQDGADALRSREQKWEDVARQTLREQRQHVEMGQPQQHHSSQYLAQTRYSLPEHAYPTNHPSYTSRPSPPSSSSSSSQHSRSPRPQICQQHTYSWHPQNYSYNVSSPQHHQDHPHQSRHQHEPRTSPLSSLSPSRSRDTSSGSTTERQQTQSMPQNLQDQHRHQQQEHQDHFVFVHQRDRERCLMPPPLPTGHSGDNETDGHEDEDPVAGISDLLRDPIRRKYR